MSPVSEPIDIDPSVEMPPEEGQSRLVLRRPDVPVTLSELAALKGEALEVIEARVQILATLRKAALRTTSPEDWVLFKAPDGRVVGYLQDCGCDRVRDLFGIEIFKVSTPEKITTNDPKNFLYVITGSGRCKLTRQIIEHVEGGRASTDDFSKGKSGAELELAVRKAARANLDGGITRELAAMGSVPIEEITDAWVGTNKKAEHCRHGRGFGTQNERVGANNEKAPDVEPPICPHCQSKGVYRAAKGDRKAFYGCPNYGKHAEKKFIVDAEKWQAEQATKAASSSTAAREPGAEG